MIWKKAIYQVPQRHSSHIFGTLIVQTNLLPEKAFLDTSDWHEQRTLDHLPSFLERFSSTSGHTRNLSVVSKQKGAPHTIIVTSSGLRAADITRFDLPYALHRD